MPDQEKPLKVFISYSTPDKAIRDEMMTHLAVLEKNGDIEFWEDGEIEGGEMWKDTIYRAMEETDIFILCVTNFFLASDFIHQHEIAFAFKKREEVGAAVVPVILRPCKWTGLKLKVGEKDYKLGDFNALPEKGKPVYSDQWYDHHTAYASMTERLQRLVRRIKEARRA
ncbi:MAG: toll/interleukin-1 receptor domain-containing protein [Bacteroidota bacterium]